VTWLDVNGDGLPDKLSEGGSVELNLGYSFAMLLYYLICHILLKDQMSRFHHL